MSEKNAAFVQALIPLLSVGPSPISIHIHNGYASGDLCEADVHLREADFPVWRELLGVAPGEVTTRPYAKSSICTEAIKNGIRAFCLRDRDPQEIYSERLTTLEKIDARRHEAAKAVQS